MSAPGMPPLRGARTGRLRAKWAQMGLRWRLTIYLGVALVLLLGAFALLSLQAVNQAQRRAFSQQITLARTMAASLEREFDHVSADVHTHLPAAPSPATAMETLAPLLEHLVKLEDLAYFRVTSVRLVDADGKAWAVAPPDTPGLRETLPAREVIRQAVAEGRTLVTLSRLPGKGEVPFAAVVVPLIASSGFPEGATVVVDTKGVARIGLFSFQRGATPEEGAEAEDSESPYDVEVLAPDGALLSASHEHVDEELGATSRHYAAIKGFVARREAGAVVHRPGGAGDPDHIVAVVPLRDAPFFLVAEEPLGLLLDWPGQLRRQAIILGAIAALIVLALGWIIGRQIVQPVAILRRATARIKRGDLETPIHVRGQGELAQLAEEVEAMRQKLQETVSSLDGLNRSLADQVHERTQQLQTVVARLMQAQEAERRRVARDLHDETAQGLTALGVILDEAALHAGQGGRRALESIRGAREQVSRLVAETRRLAYALRPSVLDDAGLVPALRWCAEAYLEASGVQVSLHTQAAEMRFPEPVEVALFRVGQEAMSNIARHARASHAWVTLEFGEDWVMLTVRDDGMGFDVERMVGEDGPPQGRGLGLAGMRERIHLLGGRLHVSSHPGEGTTVTAYVPTGHWDEEKP